MLAPAKEPNAPLLKLPSIVSRLARSRSKLAMPRQHPRVPLRTQRPFEADRPLDVREHDRLQHPFPAHLTRRRFRRWCVIIVRKV